jgi:quercetin dioxygenase-like cupin family protein
VAPVPSRLDDTLPVIPASSLEFRQLKGRASADPLPPGLADGCAARIVRIPPGPRTPHQHPRSAEIVYVAQGSGIAWENGTRTPLAAGDVIAIPPGVPHATAATATGLVLVCFFPDGDLDTNIVELDAPEVRP